MNTHRHTTDHAAAGRTTAGRTDPNRLANRFAGMNDPSMGDEREREVIYRAYVFSNVLAAVLSGIAALVLVATGAGILSLAPVIVVGIPGWAAIAYAARENVDLPTLASTTSRSRRIVTILVTIAFLALWLAGLFFHMQHGHPFVRIDVTADSDVSTYLGMACGLVVGIGGVVIAFRMLRGRHRRRLEELDED